MSQVPLNIVETLYATHRLPFTIPQHNQRLTTKLTNEITQNFVSMFQVTKEGEVLPFYQQELSIGADGGQDRSVACK